MKKIVFLICITLFTVSCNNSNEDKAEERLAAARLALEHDDFNGAKLQIDSIKTLYPKAFKTRKESQQLMCIVVLKEQQHNLRFLTSMLQTKQQEFEAIKKQYTYEKNAKYQDIGNYFWPTQTVERNLHRSYLRFQVNDQGIMTLTSIYSGGRYIHHHAIKVIASDGTYAQTPASTDVYESNDMGIKNEKADYHLGSDGGVINFLFLNRQKNIRVEYIGTSRYATVMAPADKLALTNIYSLTKVLASIQKIKDEIDDANVKIKFVLKKQKYDARMEHNSENEN